MRGLSAHGSSLATPEGACRAFVTALSAGDADTASSCFCRDACMITPDATVVRGREAIRLLLDQLIARRTEIAVEASSLLPAEDVAIARERWRIHSDGAEGARFRQSTSPTLVLRRVDGAWKLVIAAPWGWGGLASQ